MKSDVSEDILFKSPEAPEINITNDGTSSSTNIATNPPTTSIEKNTLMVYVPISIQHIRHRNLHKIEVKSNVCYGSDGELGPFCGVEVLEFTQYFDECAIPEIPLLILMKAIFDEVNYSVVEVG